jgi:DNA-nicking Smr family endonuclease
MGKKNALPTLDLHGFKKDEVFDAVDRFIMKHKNAAKVKIMPGKGEGIVRSEVVRYLKLGGYPWSFEVTDRGEKNSGCMIVFLD